MGILNFQHPSTTLRVTVILSALLNDAVGQVVEG